MEIDQAIDQFMRPLADVVASFIFYSVPLMGVEVPLIVVWLIAGGLFFTLYFRFINFRGFHACHWPDLCDGCGTKSKELENYEADRRR